MSGVIGVVDTIDFNIHIPEKQNEWMYVNKDGVPSIKAQIVSKTITEWNVIIKIYIIDLRCKHGNNKRKFSMVWSTERFVYMVKQRNISASSERTSEEREQWFLVTGKVMITVIKSSHILIVS